MREAWLLVASLVCSSAGLAWLALAMQQHWHQACGEQPPPSHAAVTLRLLGALALLASLLLCLQVDHASIASLVWVMGLAASALAVTFTLSWRPRLLRSFVPWLRTTPAT